MKGDIAMVRTVWAADLLTGDKVWIPGFGYRTVTRSTAVETPRGYAVALELNGVREPVLRQPHEHMLVALAVHSG
jgi:hypothetical protein